MLHPRRLIFLGTYRRAGAALPLASAKRADYPRQKETSMDAQSAGTAEVYEQMLVPGVTAAFAGLTLEAAKLKPGDRVLDVACGTGIVAREALRQLGPGASVTGVDANEAMLAVARKLEPTIEWQQAPAEQLPFPDASFDVVTCQFGLMFFADRVAGLRQMWRTLKPGGHLSIAVWDSLDQSPGYAALYDVAEKVAGRPVGEALREPYQLGEMDLLLGLARQAKIPGARADWWGGNATFPSLEALVASEVRSGPVSQMIDDAQYARILESARVALAVHIRPDGSISFASPALTLSAQK
jgi:ubiquinone/menaquinone biosynthesis C-methylase UbiE